jgi:hypothetical protein
MPQSSSYDTTFAPASPVPGVLLFQLGTSSTTYDTLINSVGVTSTGTIDVAGGLVDEGGTHEHLAFFAQFDNTGNFLAATTLNLGVSTTNPNYLTGMAIDSTGRAVTTGALANATTLTGGGIAISQFDASGNFLQGGVYNISAPPQNGISAGIGVALTSTGNTAYLAGEVHTTTTIRGVTLYVDLTSPTLQANGYLWFDTGDVIFTAVALKPGTPNQEYFIDNDGTTPVSTSLDVSLLDLTQPVSGVVIADYTDVSLTSTAGSIVVDQTSGDVFVSGTEHNPANPTNVTIEITHLSLSGTTLGLAGAGQTLVGSPTGSGNDTAALGSGLVEDSQGNIIGTGTTTSTDFSTDGTTLAANSDGVLHSTNTSQL